MNQISERIHHSVIRKGVKKRIPHPIYKRPIYKQKGNGKYEISELEKLHKIVEYSSRANTIITILKSFINRSVYHSHPFLKAKESQSDIEDM